jgi:hypothetical protein
MTNYLIFGRNSYRLRAAILTAILLYFATAAHCQGGVGSETPHPSPPSVTVPFVSVTNGRSYGPPLIGVLVGGHTQGAFLLDSGTNVCAVTDAFASRLGLIPNASLTKMLCDRLAVQFRGAQCVRPPARYAQQVY